MKFTERLLPKPLRRWPRKWRAFFDNVARMVSTSIADVECKHAQSQHWSDRPFATMVAKHVNAEFKAHKVEAHHQLACKIASANQISSAGTASMMKIGDVTVKMKAKQVRRKPAYMFFRDDWIKTQQQCSGETVNPASKSFWEDLKKRFFRIDP